METENDKFIHSHLIWRQPLASRLREHKHLFIIRHPRNIAISWMRHRHREDNSIVLSSKTLETIVRGGFFGHAVADFVGLHLPWLDENGVCQVRFEDLVGGDVVSLKRIAETIGAEPDPAHYTRAFGDSTTWTGEVSNWSESPYWTDAVDKAWVATGGLDVERRAGYV